MAFENVVIDYKENVFSASNMRTFKKYYKEIPTP
jgi:hypothetical protein